MNPFATLGLDSWIVRVCEKISYQRPTRIQTMTIPSILKGKNVIANAETGSGKTATFSFPILQKLSKDPSGIFALILTPNRELAFQIQEQLTIYGGAINLRCCCLTGGMDMMKQQQELCKIPHIIVGTPGRVREWVGRIEMKEYLENLKYLVMDEADRLFEEKMFEDVKYIIGKLPKERQNILTSATIDKNLSTEYVDVLLGKNAKESEKFIYFDDNREIQTVSTLKQNYLLVPQAMKYFYFVNLLKKFENLTCIIFVNTCKECHLIYFLLREFEFSVTCLHSVLTQHQRMVNLKKFKGSFSNILITTDVASRGLDIPTVEIVINFDIPRNPTDYVHRVGRTARKGKRGLAISIMTQFDVQLILNIESVIKTKLEKFEINEKEVLNSISGITKAKKNAQIKMHEVGLEERFESEKQAKMSSKNIKKTKKKKILKKQKKIE